MFEKNGPVKTGAQSGDMQEKWLVQTHEEHLAWEVKNLLARDVEQRLTAYYGPALPSHPLPTAAWLRTREQLGPQVRPRRNPVAWPGRIALRARQAVPLDIQQMYATLLLQTNYRRSAPNLRVQFRVREAQPRVSAGALGRGRISLLLPREYWQTLHKAELDMLLAAGLARCRSVSRTLLLLCRALFAVSLLLVLAAVPFSSVDRRALWVCLIAFVCCLVTGRMLVWQERALAFRADRVAVEWLGRERVCQGLHLLAERGKPSRRPTWGEPSLVERIARVCNTPVPPKARRLTLVG